MKRSARAWTLFAATRVVGLAADVCAVGAAYYGAILLRFDLRAPRWGWTAVLTSFSVVALVHVFALVFSGCYRLAWRRTRLRDLSRYFIATAAACAMLTGLRFVLPVESYAHVRPPYSVTLICFVLASVALVIWRIAWSWLWQSRASDEQLIERSVARMDAVPATGFICGRTVMVTGAGGSIGSELVRQVLAAKPKRLLMVERGENALYQIEREVRSLFPAADVRALMKDVNDVAAMREIFAEHRPEIVVHAAAYKHVPMVEANPEEGWRNNTEATRSLAELAREFGVRRFVLISTDKAVNPVSVMGKTKLAAEQAVMELNCDCSAESLAPQTSFCAVRFGNVFGSSGSVVQLFREQILGRRPVTVTDPAMERYFMTVSEAVGLVLQAASRPEKAIYTLDMGEPVRILDLAEGMIRQAGLRPYVDVPIVFTGVRPGEKLREELDVSDKSAYKTDMAKIYITKA